MLNNPIETGAKSQLNKQSNSVNSKMFLNGFFAVLLAITAITTPAITNAQTSNDDKDTKTDVKTDDKTDVKSAKDIAKDLEKEKKVAKDVKNITDRINKNKDEYTVQIRTKFLLNADNLSTIATKINTRISKIEISGEDVTEMNSKLDEANKNIKDARALLKTLPSKKSLINYDEAKKYAGTIIEARNNLEDAKTALSEIISNLKDLVIDKDNDKN